MATKVIKLREAEGVQNQNADYKIALDRTLQLNEGDTLAIKSVYLDTIAAGGQAIELSDDTTLNMDVARYFINDGGDQTMPNPNQAHRMRKYIPAPGGNVTTTGDGDVYFSCKHTPTPANTAWLEFVEYKIKTRTTRETGGLDLRIQYTRLDGTVGFHHISVPRKPGTFYPVGSLKVTVPVNLKMLGESAQLLNSRSQLNGHWIDPDKVKFLYNASPGQIGVAQSELIIDRFSMTLAKGYYAPSQLASLVTDGMVKIDSAGPVGNDLANDAFPVNSPFLKTVVLTKVENATSHFVNQDGARIITYADGVGPQEMKALNQDRLIGASQVALEYNDEHKKFAFTMLHTPIYVNEHAGGANNDGLPGVTYDAYGMTNRYSGVVFTGLGAVDSAGNNTDFWDNLGFENVCAQVESLNEAIADPNGFMNPPNTPVMPIKVVASEGAQMTAGYESLDTPVQKNENFRQPVGAGTTAVATAATLPIYGSKVFANDYKNEGYYFVELSMGINQSLTGGTGDRGFNSNKIHSIVGTYFTTNNYTIDSQGSIPYVHPPGSEPMMVSDIGVRILNASGEVPSEDLIGPNNTVFLELIKAPTQNK